MHVPEKEWALILHGNTSQIANKPWHKADSPYMTSAEDHLFWRSLINEGDLQTNGGKKLRMRERRGEEMCAMESCDETEREQKKHEIPANC
jgi:hypothetical protein